MPRLTDRMCKIQRFNQYLPNTLKYKTLLPPVLKNSVSIKKDKMLRGKAECVKEMAILMACMKKEEFKPETCMQEHLKFNKCIEESNSQLAKMKEAQKKGLQIEGSNKFPAKHVNKLLRRFPQKPAVFTLTKEQPPEHKSKHK